MGKASRLTTAVLTAAIAAGAIGAGTAAQGAGPRQTFSFAYTSQLPGTSTGLETRFEFFNPEDPGAKPHSVARMVIRTPPGSGVDTSVRPQCHASDAQLLAQGPDGCPANTKIGGGTAVADPGGGGDPSTRETSNTITNFNGDGEIIGVGVNDQTPAIKSVDHTKISPHTSSTDFPVFPGFPPPDSFTAVKSLHEVFPAYVGTGGRPYIRTPSKCPKSGYWTVVGTFTYRDGVTETATSRTPCTRPGARHRRHGANRWRATR
jgi:hypothetical protein